ncbi:MAG: hypothetical protein A2Z04_02780, partial [Chloroflexi bacterium RBG_16_57_9]
EPDELGGVSHFIEHLLFKGTQRRPTSKDISIAIEGLGGAFNASTDQEMTTYWVKIPDRHFPIALDVLVDMLCYSTFVPEEIGKERRVIIEEINATFDTPDEWVFSLANELMWPGHPLGRDVAGTRESVQRLTREDLLAHMARHYAPGIMAVAVSGRIEPDVVVGQVAAYLGDWEPRSAVPFLSFQNGQIAPRTRVGFKETEQGHLCLELPGLHYHHPDRFSQGILNAILGGGMSSRLFLEIRERQSLAYNVYSYHSHLQDSGVLGVYAAVDAGQIGPTVTAILEQLDRLRQDPVDQDELVKTKEFVKGRLQLRMEDTFAVAASLGSQAILSGRILTVDEVIQYIDAVTAEDVQRVAQDLFQAVKLNLAVVGPYPPGEDERLQELLRLE